MESPSFNHQFRDDWRQRVKWPTHKTWVVKSTYPLGRLFFRLLMNLEISGLENLPRSGACILTPNHISNFDPIAVGLFLPRHVHFMAKGELFREGFMRWYIRHTGSFPVMRGGGDDWPLQQAGRVLQAGGLLGMFPEGTRSKEGAKLRQGRVGAVKLALAYHVPIVPVAILGTQNIKVKRAQVTVTLGQPLDFTAQAGPPPYDFELYQKLTAILMKQIAAMLPPQHRGLYS